MKQIIKFCTVSCKVLFLVGWARGPTIVKVPTTRYTGYHYNHAAIERAKQFTVLISNEGFGGVDRGTGILVDARHVLTCAHRSSMAPQKICGYFPIPVILSCMVSQSPGDNTHDLALVSRESFCASVYLCRISGITL